MSVLTATIIFGILAIIFYGGWLFAPKWIGIKDPEGLLGWYLVGWLIPTAALGILIGMAMNWKGH